MVDRRRPGTRVCACDSAGVQADSGRGGGAVVRGLLEHGRQPLIYLANHTNLQPLSVMFNQISTDRADVAFAGSALYILPTLLIYLYFQEDIVAGIQLSELK